MSPENVFDIARSAETLILTPQSNLCEIDFEALESGAESVMRLLDDKEVVNVILDFHKTDYYGSTALAFFVKLWKRVKSRGGRMAFCEVSDHEREILRLTHLDSLWPICTTLDDANATVRA